MSLSARQGQRDTKDTGRAGADCGLARTALTNENSCSVERARCARRAGVTKEQGLGARFWDLFEAPKQQSDDRSADWRAAAAAGQAFALHNVAVQDSAHVSSAPSASTVQRRFSLMFRCGPCILSPACGLGAGSHWSDSPTSSALFVPAHAL